MNHAGKALRTVAVLLALLHAGALACVFTLRAAYPFDLEWMEGGVLCHALRLLEGRPLYPPPSVEFIPFLYTPLYPALLALLARLFGLSYLLGRALSIACFAGAILVGYRFAARAGGSRAAAAAAMAIPCAGYALTGTFLDLVRADALCLFLCAAASVLLYDGARDGTGARRRFREADAHVRVAGAALLLVTAFFAKQTAGPVMLGCGLALLALNFWLAPTFALTLAATGLPVLWSLDHASHGWFWKYVFAMHQGHDFYSARAWLETPRALAAIVGPALLLPPWAALWRPAPAQLYALWLALVGAGTAALASGTQWAVTNAYIPGVFFAALAIGVAAGRLVTGRRREVPRVRPIVVFAALAASLALKLPSLDGQRDDAFLDLSKARWLHRFDLRRFVPADADRAAGARVVEALRAAPGDVLVPFHPYYAHLAGKRTFVHQMGVMDVGRAGLGAPAGLEAALAERRFTLVLVDDKIFNKWMWWPGLRERYRLSARIAGPPTFSGAQTVPSEMWVPRAEAPAPEPPPADAPDPTSDAAPAAPTVGAGDADEARANPGLP